MRTILAAILALMPLSGWGTAYTSTQNGVWSAQATWGGSGPPGSGDTATISHTVIVDADTSVGTSPNNNTTGAISINGSRSLIVSNNFTLTVLGNVLPVTGSAITLNSGSKIVFDNSASGGTPVYRFSSVNVPVFNFNGTSASPCEVKAIDGQMWGLSTMNVSGFNATHTLFTRLSTSTIFQFSGTSGLTNSTFYACSNLTFNASTTAQGLSFQSVKWDSCPRITFSSLLTNASMVISDCLWTNTTGASGSVLLTLTNAFGSGTRAFYRNSLDAALTYTSEGFSIESNYFGGSIVASSTRAWARFRNNFVKSVGDTAGTAVYYPVDRSYIFVERVVGNPHFLSPIANEVDVRISQCVFEAYSDDLVDTGDCILVRDDACAPGLVISGLNNISVPSSYPSAGLMSGTLTSLVDASSNVVTHFTRNTVNADNAFGESVKRGLATFAEGLDGFAGQIAVFKSNLGWGSQSGQGYLGQRASGSVVDIITASGANYNWAWNLSAGDNQRSYESTTPGDLWTAGDAVDAGVDDNQGSGDPQFYDSTRNLAKWALARGYGSAYTDGLTALQSSPARVVDLIQYTFEGFRPGNASCRNAAADGACVGAANFYKAARTFGTLNSYRQTLSAFGL